MLKLPSDRADLGGGGGGGNLVAPLNPSGQGGWSITFQVNGLKAWLNLSWERRWTISCQCEHAL